MTAVESKEQIEEKIKELKKERENVKGTKCEVYSRVVGYLRPVAGWNEAKREEFKIRKLYSTEDRPNEKKEI